MIEQRTADLAPIGLISRCARRFRSHHPSTGAQILASRQPCSSLGLLCVLPNLLFNYCGWILFTKDKFLEILLPKKKESFLRSWLLEQNPSLSKYFEELKFTLLFSKLSCTSSQEENLEIMCIKKHYLIAYNQT